jgi:hypothetical protein
MLHAGYVPGSG